MIPPCPHCGIESGVVRNVRVYGWAEQWFNSSGYIQETSFDQINYTDTQLLRCPNCYIVRQDVAISTTSDLPHVVPKEIKCVKK